MWSFRLIAPTRPRISHPRWRNASGRWIRLAPRCGESRRFISARGGSVGLLADLKEVLGLDAVMMGLFLPEDNLHAPNESFHLGVMKKGIETSERVHALLATG